jgi:uncharacterized protein DUF6798
VSTLAFAVFYVGSLVETGVGFLVANENQELQVPLILLLNDPRLYPGDRFVATMPYYASAVWPPVAWLARLVPLPFLLVSLLLLERGLVLWAAGTLARALAPGSRIAVVGAWAMFALAPDPLIGSGTIVIAEFEHTGLAIAFILLATAALVERRVVAWTVWMALTVNANFLYAAFALTYHAAVIMLDRRCRDRWRRWLLAALVVGALGMPAALVAVAASRFASVDPALWVSALRATFPDHFFPDAWSRVNMVRFAVLALLGVGVPVVFRKREPYYARLAATWILVCAGWVLLAVVAGTVLNSPTLLTAHPARATDLWYCYTGLILIVLFAREIERSESSSRRWVGLLGFPLAVFGAGQLLERPNAALLAVALTVVSAALATVYARRHGRLPSQIALQSTVICACVLTTLASAYRVAQSPRVLGQTSVLFRGPEPDLVEVARWAQTHTRRDAVFLIPPGWGGFRALAERPAFVTWKEGAAILWRRDFATEWAARVGALGIDVRQTPRGRSTLRARLRAAWQALDAATVETLRCRYRIDYWVAPLETEARDPVVHVTKRFEVVALPERRDVDGPPLSCRPPP